MLEKLSTSVIPRTLHKVEPTYTRLKTLFESGNPLSFKWLHQYLGIIRIIETKTGGVCREQRHAFELDAINKVCTILKTSLVHVLDERSVLSAGEITRTIEVLWRHCTLNALPLVISESRETYIEAITKIHNIDIVNDHVNASFYAYTLLLGPERPHLNNTAPGVKTIVERVAHRAREVQENY